MGSKKISNTPSSVSTKSEATATRASSTPRVSLPYVPSPGSIKNALEKIKQAATPERFTRDFVATKLQIKGGTGSALIPFFKKIGFVSSDGSPSERYRQFRNHTTAGGAAAAAVKHGYASLSEANEYFYALNDKDLLALIQQVTGAAQDDQVAKLTLGALKALKAFATFDAEPQTAADGATAVEEAAPPRAQTNRTNKDSVALGLSYTINIVLPATADQSIFNSIFSSLRQHLLNAE